jgi:hypothetical protein
VVGEVNQPGCFKNVSLNNLSVSWRVNKLAINNKLLKQQNRKLLMVVDNCTACLKVENLSNITL